MTAIPDELLECFENVKDSINAALAHYQIWFTLRGRGKAIDSHLGVMNDHRYVDFFKAANIAHYKMMFIEAACAFDTDDRTNRFRRLKTLLRENGYEGHAVQLEGVVGPYTQLVSNMLTIRSKLIAHKESAISPEELYARHGIVPDRIGEMLSLVADAMREIERTFNDGASSGTTGATQRWERATYGLLEVLQNGRGS